MRRSIGSELLRMGTVMAVPLAVAAVFPYDALSFRVNPESGPASAFVTMVKLDAAAERNAIRQAKSSLRGESARLRRLQADLSFGELPEEPPRPVLAKPEGLCVPVLSPMPFGVPSYRPSEAAGRPLVIAVPKVTPVPPTFPREEMLKID